MRYLLALVLVLVGTTTYALDGAQWLQEQQQNQLLQQQQWNQMQLQQQFQQQQVQQQLQETQRKQHERSNQLMQQPAPHFGNTGLQHHGGHRLPF